MSSKPTEKAGVKKRKSKSRKEKLTSLAIVLVLVIGLGLLFYPSIANWVNSRSSTVAAAEYVEKISNTDNETIEKMLEKAEDYNRWLAGEASKESYSQKDYPSMLSLDGSSTIGTLSIPAIQVDLPIYHGTDDMALANGIGHFETSSLPVGGTDTHTVLTGHRGMPSALLLTRLDELNAGDIFTIRVLGRAMTYQIDQIHVVLPEDLSYLQIENGQDLATLVTCTPYGVNTHRLLVRGHRVDSDLNFYDAIPDAKLIRSSQVALWIAVPLIGAAAIYLYFFAGKKREEEEDYEELEE